MVVVVVMMMIIVYPLSARELQVTVAWRTEARSTMWITSLALRGQDASPFMDFWSIFDGPRSPQSSMPSGAGAEWRHCLCLACASPVRRLSILCFLV